MQERVYQTAIIILRRRDYGEADRILTVASPAGKRSLIAKGVRKPRSRLAGHLEPFLHTNVLLARGRTFDIVTQSQPLHRFDHLRTDLTRLSCAYYVADVYDHLIHDEEEASHHSFALLLQTLIALDHTHTPDLVLRAYELRMFDLVGYRPHLYHCAVCQQLLTEHARHFSPTAGGVLCPAHAHTDPAALPMDFPTFKVLRYLQRHPLDHLEQLTISAEVRASAEQLLSAYLRSLVTSDLRSMVFLESVRHADRDNHAGVHHPHPTSHVE